MSARNGIAASAVVLAFPAFAGDPAAQRTLTFEDRVKAQEAIERVYYSHQIGATEPFERGVPRDVIEKKVRASLRQTLALAAHWKTEVTGEMLERELTRMVAGSRAPQRLAELYEALGEDPVIIAECLARPLLVDRLSRNFCALDRRFHEAEWIEAQRLHEGLVVGGLPPGRLRLASA